MKYKTGNPLGSADPRDLYDTATVADNLVHGEQPGYTDRLGKKRKSWAGMEKDFDEFLANSGYTGTGPSGAIEDYAAGIEITAYNQVIRYDGELYSAKASTDLPYTTDGTWANDEPFLVARGDAALRQELASPGGSGMVTMDDGSSVQSSVSRRVVFRDDYAALKSYQGFEPVVILDDARAGTFYWISGDQSVNVDGDPNEDVWIESSVRAKTTGAWRWTPDVRTNPNRVPDYIRNSTVDGTVTDGKTLIDGAEHLFNSSGTAFKANADNLLVLEKHGDAEIPRLADQIAQNVETFVTDGDRLYTLSKGSYSLNDSSILGVYQITDYGLVSLSSGIDLGTGADCRAMTTANGYLYIFKGSDILVYNTNGFLPSLVATVPRPNSGFVQTCSIINNLLVAPVWGGTGHIETYTLQENGFPAILQNFTVTAGASNSSVVDAHDGSFLLIRHVSGTDALGRFHFNPANNRISGMTYYDVPEMLQCRYGVVRNSKLYTSSYSTGNTIEVEIDSSSIIGASRSFDNLGSFFIYDKYLIGSTYNSQINSAIDLETGDRHDVNADLNWLYPKIYGDNFVTFINGDEPDHPEALPNDSPMGQKIAVYKLRRDSNLHFPRSPVVSNYSTTGEEVTKRKSYSANGLSAGFNAVAEIVRLPSLAYSWVEIKCKGIIVEDQSNTSSPRKAFAGQAIATYSAGVWTIRDTFTEYGSLGASGLTPALSVFGDRLQVGFSPAGNLPQAIMRFELEIRAQEVSGIALD